MESLISFRAFTYNKSQEDDTEPEALNSKSDSFFAVNKYMLLADAQISNRRNSTGLSLSLFAITLRKCASNT